MYMIIPNELFLQSILTFHQNNFIALIPRYFDDESIYNDLMRRRARDFLYIKVVLDCLIK